MHATLSFYCSKEGRKFSGRFRISRSFPWFRVSRTLVFMLVAAAGAIFTVFVVVVVRVVLVVVAIAVAAAT